MVGDILRLSRHSLGANPTATHAAGCAVTNAYDAIACWIEAAADMGRCHPRLPRARQPEKIGDRTIGLYRDPVDLRAGVFRRVFRRLGGDASAAHAADGGYQRDLLGDHRRRADCCCCGRHRCRIGRSPSSDSSFQLDGGDLVRASTSSRELRGQTRSLRWRCTRKRLSRPVAPATSQVSDTATRGTNAICMN